MTARRVVKVGGSLLDLPDLGSRLCEWRRQLPSGDAVWIPGGGALADTIRDYDDRFDLPAERTHWIAVGTMTLNARLLSLLLDLPMADCLATARAQECVLDVEPVLRQEEPLAPAPRLPHDWTVTSDAIAARIAQLLPVEELWLLKSRSAPPQATPVRLADLGLVDKQLPCFASGLQVHVVNLRESSD